MNRLEEIREKFKRRSLDEKEVEWLLSRLEIAEKALKDMLEIGITEDEMEMYLDVLTIRNIAGLAIKQLRE